MEEVLEELMELMILQGDRTRTASQEAARELPSRLLVLLKA